MSDSSSEDVTLNSSESAPVVEAASTTVTTESTEPASVLDAVEAALKTDGVEAGSPPAENRSEDAKPEPKQGSEEAPKDDDGNLSEDEKKAYSPRAQERIRDLAARKNELQGQVEQLTQQIEPLRTKSEQFDQLTSYLKQSNISSDEANNSLEITRLIKAGDFPKALQVLTPIYNELVQRTGGVLDQDLREEVRLGHLELNRAQEIQRGRAAEANSREREQQRTQQEQQRQQETERNQQIAHVQSVAQAADDWAKEKAGADPDWNQKADLVAAQVQVLISSEGFPKSKADAIKMSERALETVEKRIGAFRPKPTAINPARPTGSASPAELPPPKTPLEAVERGLNQ